LNNTFEFAVTGRFL